MGPGRGVLDAQPESALSAGEAGGDVEQPVTQRLRLGLADPSAERVARAKTYLACVTPPSPRGWRHSLTQPVRGAGAAISGPSPRYLAITASDRAYALSLLALPMVLSLLVWAVPGSAGSPFGTPWQTETPNRASCCSSSSSEPS